MIIKNNERDYTERWVRNWKPHKFCFGFITIKHIELCQPNTAKKQWEETDNDTKFSHVIEIYFIQQDWWHGPKRNYISQWVKFNPKTAARFSQSGKLSIQNIKYGSKRNEPAGTDDLIFIYTDQGKKPAENV